MMLVFRCMPHGYVLLKFEQVDIMDRELLCSYCILLLQFCALGLRTYNLPVFM